MAQVDDAARRRAAVKDFPAVAAALLSALLLVACSEPGEDKKPATQVAARVNSSEISIHQVNFALRHASGLAPEQVSEAKRQILDELVDQELAVQEAVAAKLDRNPDIMQSIEAARRDILARAYLDQATTNAPQPTPEEISAYYRQHPELFTGRKIYHLQELSLPPGADVMAMAREQLALGRNAADLQAWFKGRHLKVDGRVLIKPAEKVDLDLLPKLAAMKEGQTTLVENGSGASVITVLAVLPEPLAEDEARPLIDQYLKRQRSEALEKETLRQLRAKARIEYLGEFSTDAETARKRKAAEAARQSEEAKVAREAARQARAAEVAARQADAAKGRDGADPANGQPAKPASLVSPSEVVIGKGVSDLK